MVAVWVALILAGLMLAVLYTVCRMKPRFFRVKASMMKIFDFDIEMRGPSER